MQSMKAAANQTQQTGKSIESAMNSAKTAVKGLAAAIAVDALVGATQRAFDYADAIVDLSDKTGASTKSIQEFRYAAQLSGSSVEDADAALGKFTKNIGDAQNGSDAMTKTLRDLGVTSLNVDTALKQVIDGISKLPSKAQQNAAAMTLFGKSAGSLTYLLGQGGQSFDELADKADKLGIVMGDDLLRNAGQVNDQLDTMKMIMNAQFASALVSNADAIGGMAQSVISLSSAMANFWGQNPQKAFAIMGALGGAAIGARVGGPWGAAAGAVAGGVGGAMFGRDVRESTYARNDKWVAANDLYLKAIEGEKKLREAGASRAAQGRVGEVGQRALATRRRLEAGIDNGSITIGDLPKLGGTTPTGDGEGGTLRTPTSKTKKPKSGPSAADKEADRLADYQRDFQRATEEEMAARKSLSNNVTDQAGFERQLLDAAKKRELADIAHDEAKGKLKADEATALRGLVEQTYKAKEQLVTNEETDKLISEVLALKNNEIDIERDKLSFAQAEARSSSERRDIALRLVDLEYKKEKLALEAIRDSKTATDAEKQIAEARLRALPGLRAQAEGAAKRDNQGPLGQYLDAIPRTAGEINEQLERVQTEGLDNLQDGLLGVIKGTESLGSAFGNMVDGILDGLIKIGLQQAIIKPLGNLLFGGSGEGGGSGILGSIFGSIFKGATGARANGGLTQPGRYLVGERGLEFIDIGAPANVVPNHQIKGGGGNNGGVNISFGPITSNDPAAVRAAAIEAVASMMPMIKDQSANHTIAKLNAARLR
jgi:hypothetical protein